MMGFVEIDLVDLIRHRGAPVRRISQLSSPDSRDRPGSVEYTIGYYAKRPPTASLRSDGQDPGIPDDLRDKPEFRNAREIALNDLEAAVLVTPPDPAWPSGIVSVQVHEIRGLGIRREGRERNIIKTKSSGEGEKGQDEQGQEVEEGEGLPSSYCSM